MFEPRTHAKGREPASELANYEKLKARERQVLRVGALPDDVIRDIETAVYAAKPE